MYFCKKMTMYVEQEACSVFVQFEDDWKKDLYHSSITLQWPPLLWPFSKLMFTLVLTRGWVGAFLAFSPWLSLSSHNKIQTNQNMPLKSRWEHSLHSLVCQGQEQEGNLRKKVLPHQISRRQHASLLVQVRPWFDLQLGARSCSSACKTNLVRGVICLKIQVPL